MRRVKKCKACSKEFRPADSGYIYCSAVCSYIGSRKVTDRLNPETLKMLMTVTKILGEDK
jgi:hypothetical protein